MIPFHTTNWDYVPLTSHAGETGTASWKTLLFDKFRIRLIEYSPNYRADHWCSIGHIIYCLEGEFISHLKDGSQHHLHKGMSYQTSDDELNPHMSTSEKGCKLFVVDGDFLKPGS